jgi:hypothetical protein
VIPWICHVHTRYARRARCTLALPVHCWWACQPCTHPPTVRPPCASPGHDHGPYGALPLGAPGDVALLGSACPAARPTTTLWHATYGYYGTVWISSVLNGIKGGVSLDTPSQLVHTIIDHVAHGRVGSWRYAGRLVQGWCVHAPRWAPCVPCGVRRLCTTLVAA